MLRRVLVRPVQVFPTKAVSSLALRACRKEHKPYKITKLGELLFVSTVELEVRDWINDDPSIEFPLTKHYSSADTRIFGNDGFC